jgi:hypothetical protein
MKKLFAIAATLGLSVMMMSGFACADSCGNDSRVIQRLEIESILDDVAMIHSIDPDLLSAMAKVESGECYDAVSPKGAVGLMQLMPATASTFGVENRFDPVQNALGAARFIDYLKRSRPEGRFSLVEILAAYNAGERAVTRAGGIPHYRETEAYVRRVLWLYLIGHVPESVRAREKALDASLPSKPKPQAAAVASVGHRYAPGYAPGSDRAILERLAEVRRARRQSDEGSETATVFSPR